MLRVIDRSLDRIAGRLEQIDGRIAGMLAAVLLLLERLDARKCEPDGEQSQAGRGEIKARLNAERVQEETDKSGHNKD